MNLWEVFVNELRELAEDTDLELTVRTLNPGRYKYTYKRVRCRVSADLGKHPDQLQVRLGRGQLSASRFSILVLDEIQRLPPKYR